MKRINFANYSLSPANVVTAMPTEHHNIAAHSAAVNEHKAGMRNDYTTFN